MSRSRKRRAFVFIAVTIYCVMGLVVYLTNLSADSLSGRHQLQLIDQHPLSIRVDKGRLQEKMQQQSVMPIPKKGNGGRKIKDAKRKTTQPFSYQLHHRGMNLSIEYILPYSQDAGQLLKEKVTLPNEERNTSILVMFGLSFDDTNIRGCPDWNCHITNDLALLPNASAVFMVGVVQDDKGPILHHHPDQYFVFYSQESPVNSGQLSRSFKEAGLNADAGYFNMSISYRWDTASPSPYGYSVRLAESSRKERSNWMEERFEKSILDKSKAMAWFVSHCGTPNQRETLVERLQKHGLQVDVYGGCGMSGCVRDSPECSEKLNKEYFFYYAAENSLCKDYITEKLWNQGYRHFIVPIVLRRAIVEPYLPPHSFIAADDFPSAKAMAAYLTRLMEKKHEYLKYFEWRLSYEVITLDGDTHPSAERPFGFCQICRLTQQRPRPPQVIIADPVKWWDESCESDQSALVQGLLRADDEGDLEKVIDIDPMQETETIIAQT